MGSLLMVAESGDRVTIRPPYSATSISLSRDEARRVRNELNAVLSRIQKRETEGRGDGDGQEAL